MTGLAKEMVFLLFEALLWTAILGAFVAPIFVIRELLVRVEHKYILGFKPQLGEAGSVTWGPYAFSIVVGFFITLFLGGHWTFTDPILVTWAIPTIAATVGMAGSLLLVRSPGN